MRSDDVQSLAESAAKIHDSAVLITDTMHGLPAAIAAELARSGRPQSTASATASTNPSGSLALACAVLLGVNITLAPIIVLGGIRMWDLDEKISAIYMMAPHLKPEQPK